MGPVPQDREGAHAQQRDRYGQMKQVDGDDRASEAQLAGIQAVFGGEAGGWPGEFARLIGDFRGVEVVPIRMEMPRFLQRATSGVKRSRIRPSSAAYCSSVYSRMTNFFESA